MKHLLTFIACCILPLSLLAQDDPYDIGWNPNGYLNQTHTIEYCLKRQTFTIEHLWLKTESSYQMFLNHGSRFKHIDSLTIGDNLLCAIINQLESNMLQDMAELPALAELEFLSINMYSMKNPLKNLKRFTQLKYLEIGGSYTQIPEELWELTQLEHLNLYGKFSNVSPKINQLTQLKSLILQGDYENIPTPTGPLNQLRYLNMTGEFNSIPAYLKYCPNLRFLEIISDLPMVIGDHISTPSHLEVLILSNNVITNFSPQIAQLQQLKEIHLSCTWLDRFPEGLSKLKALEDIRLDVMCLDEELEDNYGSAYSKIPTLHIPASIRQLTALEWLDLTGRVVPNSNIQQLLKAFPDADIEYGPWE